MFAKFGLRIIVMQTNIAFLTVIYPGVEKFLSGLFESLCNQTHNDFQIIALNENVTSIHKYIPTEISDKITVLDVSGLTPVENRIHLIEYAIDNDYEFLIFGDSDDCFDPNRVEHSLALLEQYPVVVNDIHIADSSGNINQKNYFSNRLPDLRKIDLEFIRDKNIFGLSNTAIRTESILFKLTSKSVVAYDWYFFSKLLFHHSGKAIFTSGTTTIYRQYRNNTIGIGLRDEASIINNLKIKIEHYRALGEINGYPGLLKAYLSLYDDLKDNNIKKEEYIRYIYDSKIDYPLWFENIVPLNE